MPATLPSSVVGGRAKALPRRTKLSSSAFPFHHLTTPHPGASVFTVSVSNDSAGGYDPKPDWPALRREYETTRISHRKLSKLRNVPYATLSKRAMREGWSQKARIIRQAAAKLESDLPATVQAEIHRELAPWIEAKKTEWTKRGVKIAKSGFDRVEKIFASNPEPDAKMESFVSKAAETYHRIGRVALGMADGTAPGGAIQLNILTNRAAVQVVSPVS